MQLSSPTVNLKPKWPLVPNPSIRQWSHPRVLSNGVSLAAPCWPPSSAASCALTCRPVNVLVCQQEHMGAEFAYSRDAEAVKAAPWPSQKQTPGEICMFVWSQCSRRPGTSLGSISLHWTFHTTEPLEDDKWMDWILMANVLCKSWSTSWPVPSPFLSYRSCLNASFSMRTIMFLRK